MYLYLLSHSICLSCPPVPPNAWHIDKFQLPTSGEKKTTGNHRHSTEALKRVERTQSIRTVQVSVMQQIVLLWALYTACKKLH